MRLDKPYTRQEYANLVEWCNSHNASIEDKGNYLESVETPISIDEVKAKKIEALKSIRDSEEVQPIEYDGKLWDFDDKSQQRINGAIIALSVQDGASLEWTLADNTTTTVTADTLKQVVMAVAVRSNMLHNKYRTLKDQVNACTTAEEIASVEW